MVKAKFHRPIEWTLKACNIIMDIDQWFAAFTVEEEPVEKNAGPGQVGVDVRISNVVALSDGTLAGNPRLPAASVGWIKSLQRALSRKKKGSHNREKAKV